MSASPDSASRGEVIQSPKNPSYKVWRSLLTGRGLRKRGRALVSGAKVVSEILSDYGGMVEACLLPDNDTGPPEALPPGVRCYRLPGKLLRELDPGESGPPLLVTQVPEMAVWHSDDAPAVAGCTLFIPFQDPVNVGAVLRTAAAFGVARAVLLKESAHPFHPRSLQAGGSAPFRLPLLRGPALRDLHTGSLPAFALDLAGVPLRDVRFPDAFALIAGLEGSGLPPMIGAVTSVRIPISPEVDSLNAASATAIALYQWSAQHTGVPAV